MKKASDRSFILTSYQLKNVNAGYDNHAVIQEDAIAYDSQLLSNFSLGAFICMDIAKLETLKLYLEKLEKDYSHELATRDIKIYGDFYHQKLREVRQRLWYINQTLDNLKALESDRIHLSKCYSQDVSLGHPVEKELNP